MISGAIAGYFTTKIGGSDPKIFALAVVTMGTVAWLLACSTALLRRRSRKSS